MIDSGKPCNRQTSYTHNFLTRDGETPVRLTAIAREQMAVYPSVTIIADRVATLAKEQGKYTLTTDQKRVYQAHKVLLSTGVEDLMLPIDGFVDCWGRSVVQCPYCHGYEVQDQPLAVLGNGDGGFDFVQLIRHWSRNLILLTNGAATLTDEQRSVLGQLDVPIIESSIAAIEHKHGLMSALHLNDSPSIELTALFTRVPFRQHSDLAQQVGASMTPTGLIAVSEFGQTSVPGLYAAGDNSTFIRQLTMASARGGTAGAFLNQELVNERL